VLPEIGASNSIVLSKKSPPMSMRNGPTLPGLMTTGLPITTAPLCEPRLETLNVAVACDGGFAPSPDP